MTTRPSRLKPCNYCGVNEKRPGRGQRFCSDLCAEASKVERHKPTREENRVRAATWRRSKGVKERLPAWNEDGKRRCPGCGNFFDVTSDEWHVSYCTPCYRYKRREYTLRTKYGLTVEQYDDMLLAQDGRCAICRNEEERLDVDHCHETGVVRGLLCVRCNYQLLGLHKEDVELFRRAIEYVERTRSN